MSKITADILPIADVENALKIGDKKLFEYHCNESHESSDADLWYHSHQQVEILGMDENDGVGIYSQDERYECGHPLAYRVRFADGFEHTAMEDELLDSADDYCRPDPPKPLKR